MNVEFHGDHQLIANHRERHWQRVGKFLQVETFDVDWRETTKRHEFIMLTLDEGDVQNVAIDQTRFGLIEDCLAKAVAIEDRFDVSEIGTLDEHIDVDKKTERS
jgi:hypothetical protein